MPKKTCPQCGAKHGTRKKKCDCGYSFDSKHPLYPEPGAGILDVPKGMPKMELPEPLPRDRKLTTKEVSEYISYEGLGFCIHGYIDSNMIEDTELAKLWTSARRAMQRIVEFIG